MAQFLWYDFTFKKQCTIPVTLTFDLWSKSIFFGELITTLYSTNHVYLHRPNAFGFWQMRLHLCYETLKRISNFSELA